MEPQCIGNSRSITYFKANFYTACTLLDNDLATPGLRINQTEEEGLP